MARGAAVGRSASLVASPNRLEGIALHDEAGPWLRATSVAAAAVAAATVASLRLLHLGLELCQHGVGAVLTLEVVLLLALAMVVMVVSVVMRVVPIVGSLFALFVVMVVVPIVGPLCRLFMVVVAVMPSVGLLRILSMAVVVMPIARSLGGLSTVVVVGMPIVGAPRNLSMVVMVVMLHEGRGVMEGSGNAWGPKALHIRAGVVASAITRSALVVAREDAPEDVALVHGLQQRVRALPEARQIVLPA